MLGRAAGRDHRDHTLARGNFDLRLRNEVERVAHSEVQRILDELDRHGAELLGDILRHIACKLHGDRHRRQVDELDAELHLQRLDELLLRDKAGVVYQEKCAIAINFFLKIVNNLQYFSPFRTYFTIHISFFLKFIVHFLPSADGSPVFLRKRLPFPLFFQSFLAKQQEKPGKFPLNVPWFCAKFTLSIKCFLKTRINSFCLALAFPVPIFLSARLAAAFLQKSAP